MPFKRVVLIPGVDIDLGAAAVGMREGVIFGCILAAALVLRAVGLWHERLWTDEVFSATFAVQPFFRMLIANLRFDQHPPLYYIQLHFWALISHSTLWLFLNSLAWSWLAVLALWRCSRRLFSLPVALLATLLFAAMPVGVEWSHSLRMYGMLGVLSILVWFFSYRFLIETPFKRHAVGQAACMLAITYANGAGVVILGYAGVYGLYLMAQARPDRTRVWWWIKMYLVTAVLALPQAVNVLMRDAKIDVPMPTPPVIARTFAHLISGPVIQLHLWPWAALLAIALGVFILVGFLADARVRALLVGFVVTPLAVGVAISYSLHSMWADRLFFFETPFLAIAAATCIFTVARALGRVTAGLAQQIAVVCTTAILVTGLGAASVWAAERDLKPTDYRAAATEIRAGLRPGDLVFVPEAEAFWGIAWYLVGPDWGSPLAIQDPSDFSKKWVRILHWLGPVWRTRLGLQPCARMISYDGATLLVGLSIPPIVSSAKRVWLVNEFNNRHPPVRLPGFAERVQEKYRGLTVQLLVYKSAS